jgi:hypothetical protein
MLQQFAAAVPGDAAAPARRRAPPPPPLRPPPPQSSPAAIPPRPVHAIDAPAAAVEAPEYKITPGGSGHTLGRCARGVEFEMASMENRVENQDRVRERTQYSCSFSKSPLPALCCVLAKYIPAKWVGAAGIDLKRSCSPECARGVLSHAAKGGTETIAVTAPSGDLRNLNVSGGVRWARVEGLNACLAEAYVTVDVANSRHGDRARATEAELEILCDLKSSIPRVVQVALSLKRMSNRHHDLVSSTLPQLRRKFVVSTGAKDMTDVERRLCAAL